MPRLLVLAEGQTEEGFVNSVLSEYQGLSIIHISGELAYGFPLSRE
jgi:hypothetical protein